MANDARLAFAMAALVVVGCSSDTASNARDGSVDGHGNGGTTGTSSDASAAGAPFDGGTRTLPIIPIGYDAYTDWAHLPRLRIGTRTTMRSTYDRAGGNEGSDASHFLRQNANGRFVALDVAGPGVLYFARANHWHGSPWHYGVDGADNVVSESSTATPTTPVANSVYLPAASFPPPFAETWSMTGGADLSWIPLPFQNSLTVAYERTHYGTGYFIEQSFPEGAPNLSHPITQYDPGAPPAVAVGVLNSAGSDIAPTGAAVTTTSGSGSPDGGTTLTLADLHGAGEIRALTLRVSADQVVNVEHARLRVTWDGRASPSIDAPLALFFGAGSLYNRTNAEWLVKGLLESVHFTNGDVVLASYFPMPFFRGAHLELELADTAVTNVRWEIRTTALDDDPNALAYFHATYRDHGVPVAGRDLTVLDTTATEGGGDFCGTFNGMSFDFSDHAVFTTLEGDPRFFFDDSGTPQAQGTGTEEWAGGGDYWGGQTTTLPLAGHPVGAPSVLAAANAEDQIESAYRLLVADVMPFGKNARIQLEHGGVDDSTEHYQSVAYWYGRPGACLALTDSFHVGDATDEVAHAYTSPTASSVDSITSRYELGVDHVGATEIYPATTDTGRHMTGTTEFRIQIRSDNYGLLLRRKLDYSYPDQRADVFIADDVNGAAFARAGTWYLAGSNTCVYSNPPGELDAPTPMVETSNRRFRDDEFLVPSQLTRGKRAVRVRLVFSPPNQPLETNQTPAAAAWSELRYSVYSWVLPP
ncbi:MAG TPA: DUF2961 domain-containing protein [Polyangiaceae bacterium]|nr:DUF2961 domain-containing protein [Polyangiaceae bacterium]